MSIRGRFPFGQPVRDIVQTDQTAKKVFILGVYASAVHAQWKGVDNRVAVQALAVASEPYIFWRGDGAENIINRIAIPANLGRLLPASKQFNGPSGIALDEYFLKPLNLSRDEVWLCDLVPHSCVNPAQQRAIERSYLPIAEKYALAEPTVPKVPSNFSNEVRRQEIIEEIRFSQADVLILLGDQPIKWFLRFFDERWEKLANFGNSFQFYGQLHQTRIGNRSVTILPLAHPRQVAKLGRSSNKWYEFHQYWCEHKATAIFSG